MGFFYDHVLGYFGKRFYVPTIKQKNGYLLDNNIHLVIQQKKLDGNW